MAVVKLYLSDSVSNHTTWVERFTGTVSLTKDYSRKSYFLQIFDMDFYQKVCIILFRNKYLRANPSGVGTGDLRGVSVQEPQDRFPQF